MKNVLRKWQRNGQWVLFDHHESSDLFNMKLSSELLSSVKENVNINTDNLATN